MWVKSVLSIAFLFGLGTLILVYFQAIELEKFWPGYKGVSEWKDLDSREHLILFSPPDLGNITPRITVKVRENTDSRSEWVCWRNFQSEAANACITYQEQGAQFAQDSASDNLGYNVDFLEDIKYVITDKNMMVGSELGEFSTASFTYKLSGHKKDCISFSTVLKERNQLIHGWYCAAVNETVNESIVETMISTIGLKGRYEPRKVTYAPIEIEPRSSQTESPASQSEIPAQEAKKEMPSEEPKEALPEKADLEPKPEKLSPTLTDDLICKLALSTKDGTPRWENQAAYRDYVTQAKSLGLTPGNCADLLGLESVQTAKELPEEGSLEQRLTKLKNLHDKGLITKEQYDRKRGEILEAL